MSHPYERYENSSLWNAFNRGLDDLSGNEDIVENTAREYIVGYLCEMIVHSGLTQTDWRP